MGRVSARGHQAREADDRADPHRRDVERLAEPLGVVELEQRAVADARIAIAHRDVLAIGSGLAADQRVPAAAVLVLASP